MHGHSTHIDKLALLSPDVGPLCREAEAADDEEEDEDEDDEDDEDDVQAQFFQVCRALRRHYSHSCLIWKCRDVVSFAFLPLLWLIGFAASARDPASFCYYLYFLAAVVLMHMSPQLPPERPASKDDIHGALVTIRVPARGNLYPTLVLFQTSPFASQEPVVWHVARTSF